MKYLVRGREHNCPVIHNSRSCQMESLVTGGADSRLGCAQYQHGLDILN